MNKFVKMFYITRRFISKVVNNKKVRIVAHRSYQVYSIARVVRNPFVLLEYINIFNGLKLIKNKF